MISLLRKLVLVSGYLKLVVADEWAAVALSSASRRSPIVTCLLAIVPDTFFACGETSGLRFSYLSELLEVVYLNDFGINPLGTLRRMSSLARALSFTLWMVYLYALES
jgi:hypothetical protein